MRPDCQLFKMALRETRETRVSSNRLINCRSACRDALSTNGKSLPSFAEGHGCKPVDECEVGTLRSLGEGGCASEGSALRSVWRGATAVRPWGSTDFNHRLVVSRRSLIQTGTCDFLPERRKQPISRSTFTAGRLSPSVFSLTSPRLSRYQAR